jgi:hypothetical protein
MLEAQREEHVALGFRVKRRRRGRSMRLCWEAEGFLEDQEDLMEGGLYALADAQKAFSWHGLHGGNHDRLSLECLCLFQTMTSLEPKERSLESLSSRHVSNPCLQVVYSLCVNRAVYLRSFNLG